MESREQELVEAVGARVREIRKANGYTQEKLAEESGLDRSYVGHIEQARQCMSIYTAKKIAEALGTTLSELLKDL